LIYGGFNQDYLTDYYSFNTINNNWTSAEIDGDGPSPRERSTLVPYIEDKLVLFGGYYCSPDMEVEHYFNDVYVLNLSIMEWIQPSVEGDLPHARSAHTSNFVKGKMYMFGGITKQQYLDAQTNTHRSIPLEKDRSQVIDLLF
jgi:N-acetylneuraminic acid mutarotase